MGTPPAVPPLDPVEAEPVAAGVVEATRVVPLAEVFALDEMVLLLLAVDNAVAMEAVFDVAESAEVEVTALAPVVLLVLLELIADVEAAEAITPAVVVGVRRALPAVADDPEPAPEEEPAVLEALDAEDAEVAED